MTKLRTFLLCASVLVLGACGGTADDAAPNAAAPTAPIATSAAPAVSLPPAEDSGADAKTCTSIDAAGTAMKKDLVDALMKSIEGEPDPAVFKEPLTNFATAVSAAAPGGGSAVGTAATALSDAATKAAASDDPSQAVEGDAFEKAYNDLADACNAAGIKIQK